MCTCPCLSRNFESLCRARCRSHLASSRARERSRAASHSSSGTHTSVMFLVARGRARNSASLRSVFLPLSAGGLSILGEAPATQSTPGALSSRARCQPVGPDS